MWPRIKSWARFGTGINHLADLQISQGRFAKLLERNMWCYSGGRYWYSYPYALSLTHWGLDKMESISQTTFSNEKLWNSIKISLKFVPKGPINNIPALVQMMAWRQPGDKPLSEPMMASVLTHRCVTRSQWVKSLQLFWRLGTRKYYLWCHSSSDLQRPDPMTGYQDSSPSNGCWATYPIIKQCTVWMEPTVGPHVQT